MRDQLSADGTTSFDDVGSGLPVVLLHAFPLSRTMWRPQREALEEEYRVIAPDLRGFGGTRGFDGPPSVDRMADDVAGLLDGLGVRDRVVLGGLSMGGYVALAFARRHPGRLRGLVLADTKAEPDDAQARASREQMITLAREGGARAVIDRLLPRLVGEETVKLRPEVPEEVRAIASSQTPAGIVGALEAMRDRPDATPDLEHIQVPTLVVVGQQDEPTPLAYAEVLADEIPDALLVDIPGAGHLSNLEQPELFNAALRAFLQELP
jgi:3-oxoadipate enol-lactonase